MESKRRQLELAKRIAIIIILLRIFCNLLESIQAIENSNRFELKKKEIQNINKQTKSPNQNRGLQLHPSNTNYI